LNVLLELWFTEALSSHTDMIKPTSEIAVIRLLHKSLQKIDAGRRRHGFDSCVPSLPREHLRHSLTPAPDFSTDLFRVGSINAAIVGDYKLERPEGEQAECSDT
jgi:hypothetical protein